MSKTEFSANTVNSADRMRDLLYEEVRHIPDTCSRRNLPGFTKEARENCLDTVDTKEKTGIVSAKVVARLFRGEGLLADCEENPPRLKTRATTTGIKI